MNKELPVAYFSHKFSDTEKNWPVYDPEMLAVMQALSR